MLRDPGNDLEVAVAVGPGVKNQTLRLSREQRAKQVLICGVPGSGKTKLMEHMIRQDIRQFEQVASRFDGKPEFVDAAFL